MDPAHESIRNNPIRVMPLPLPLQERQLRFNSHILPVALFCLATAGLFSQAQGKLQWRQAGNTSINLNLSGVATGPMDQVLWSAAGDRLFARSASRQWFVMDIEDRRWQPLPAEPASGLLQPAARIPNPALNSRIPEKVARTLDGGAPGVVLAAGEHVWRSSDEGRSWRNLTFWRGQSVLGGPVSSASPRPGNSEEIAVAASTGIWRSADGGLSWTSENQGLPQLPVRRILSLPDQAAGLRIELAESSGQLPAAFEWEPGESVSWTPVPGLSALEQATKVLIGRQLNAAISVIAYAGDFLYAGSTDGRIWHSPDKGRNWNPPASYPGATIEAFALDPLEPRRALATLRRDAAGPVVLRTNNGGLFWDDLSANLPVQAVYGIAADYVSGAIYAATPEGLYLTETDLQALAPPTQWRRLETAAPQAAVMDVRLDSAGHILYAALQGYGVFSATAPHRRKHWNVVSSADWASRPAAPGALMSILGAKLDRVQAGEQLAVVLHASESETQIQLPFDVAGDAITLTFNSQSGLVRSSLPLVPAAPAILVDRDGSPMILDAGTGLVLDARNPARAGSEIQVLASGLGRVSPQWTAGTPATASASPGETPAVAVPIRVWLDATPLEVIHASLAPGYVGYYLVQVRLPDVLDAGRAELFFQAGNSLTNRVRLYIEP